MDKKDLIAELVYLAMDKNVDGKTFYYLQEAIMEMFRSLGGNEG